MGKLTLLITLLNNYYLLNVILLCDIMIGLFIVFRLLRSSYSKSYLLSRKLSLDELSLVIF